MKTTLKTFAVLFIVVLSPLISVGFIGRIALLGLRAGNELARNVIDEL